MPNHIHNGGFDTGDLSGWDTIGDVSVQTASFGSPPKNGSYQAVLTTFWSMNGPTPLSGNDAVSNGIEPFLGLEDRHVGSPLVSNFLNELSNSRYIGGGPGRVTNGSAIKQQFQAHAGSQLTVHYNFLAEGHSNGHLGNANDFAFVSLISDKVLQGFIIAGVESQNHPSHTVLPYETGYHPFTLTIPFAGKYTLGIGVVQMLDELGKVALCVDKISVS